MSCSLTSAQGGSPFAGSPGLDREEILKRVSAPVRLIILDSVDSTNSYALDRAEGDFPLCVLADSQTAGRGRRGRSFASPPGTGIYLSVARRMPLSQSTAPLLTMGTAVMACRAIERAAGVSCGIKWVNDLYYRGLKAAGILVEARTDGGFALVVSGIGINCFPGGIPEDLSHIAGPLSDLPGSFSRSALAGELIEGIIDLMADPSASSFLSEYRERCFVTGSEIILSSFDGRPPLRAEALEIADSGALIVRYLEGPLRGSVRAVTSGEVSLRLP